jgi:hypothetical protein
MRHFRPLERLANNRKSYKNNLDADRKGNISLERYPIAIRVFAPKTGNNNFSKFAATCTNAKMRLTFTIYELMRRIRAKS